MVGSQTPLIETEAQIYATEQNNETWRTHSSNQVSWACSERLSSLLLAISRARQPGSPAVSVVCLLGFRHSSRVALAMRVAGLRPVLSLYKYEVEDR